MLILQAALTALLAAGTTANPQPPKAPPAIVAFAGPELARALKTDLESISGSGTVTVNVDHETHFNVRIALRGINSRICTQIYDRETALQQLYPGLTFDFNFDGPGLARAIKADLESISGRDTVDVSIDSKTLFSVRIAIPGFTYDTYNRIFDRGLEFYRVFRDLNFDFYVRPKSTDPAGM